eukprot:SAG11_NODE_9713_length_887_cov_0.883249_2_plen_94_part_00
MALRPWQPFATAVFGGVGEVLGTHVWVPRIGLLGSACAVCWVGGWACALLAAMRLGSAPSMAFLLFSLYWPTHVRPPARPPGPASASVRAAAR